MAAGAERQLLVFSAVRRRRELTGSLLSLGPQGPAGVTVNVLAVFLNHKTDLLRCGVDVQRRGNTKGVHSHVDVLCICIIALVFDREQRDAQ